MVDTTDASPVQMCGFSCAAACCCLLKTVQVGSLDRLCHHSSCCTAHEYASGDKIQQQSGRFHNGRATLSGPVQSCAIPSYWRVRVGMTRRGCDLGMPVSQEGQAFRGEAAFMVLSQSEHHRAILRIQTHLSSCSRTSAAGDM
eukprot:365661-Chlamydomonas_euryale.AAC.72